MDITTLITDIQQRITQRDGWFTDELSREFSSEVGRRLSEQLGAAERKPTLRLSQMGPRCPKALWNSIHHPELAEKLPPWAEIKYSFGHILEALAITLAKAAGHHVTGEQDALEVDGVVGHRDCIIDGHIVDVKSASSFSFQKFKDGSIRENDSFGYLDQLDGYLCGSLSDPLVTDHQFAYLLAIDKQLGHMCLYKHEFREQHIRERIRYYKEIVARDTPPKCECGTKAIGKSGNIGLDTKAQYSLFKHSCFDGIERPKLRTFLYASGPEYLVNVARTPEVPEVDYLGKLVYN